MAVPRILLGLAGLTGLTGLASISSVPAGHVGIKDTFGKVEGKEYLPGLHFINPFAVMVKICLQTRVLNSEIPVTSKEGLNIDVSIDTVFNLKREQARNIYMNVGSGFENILLKPQIQSLIRDTISGYDTKDLYRDETRGEIRTKLLTEIQKKQEANGIAVTDMLISKIKLPTQLHHSIEEKLKSEQEMQRMNFVIEAARKEAERKAIEAEGIKRFQDIVSKGISQELLKWKAIEVTKDLAASPNTKIIVTGGRDGLPIILNDK